jgi:opacity protein-like surface antigen
MRQFRGRIGMGIIGLLAVSAEAMEFSAGPMAGVTFSGSTEDDITVVGAQASWRYAPRVSVELAAMQLTDQPEEERFGISVEADQDILPVMVSIRYSHPLVPERLEGYVLGGVGWYFGETSSYDIRGHESGQDVVVTGDLEVRREDAFGYHSAIGMEWFATRRVSVLAEFRYSVMDTDARISGLSARTPAGQQAIDAFERDFMDNNDMGMLRLGVNWHL